MGHVLGEPHNPIGGGEGWDAGPKSKRGGGSGGPLSPVLLVINP